MYFPKWLNKEEIAQDCFNMSRWWIYNKINNKSIKRTYKQEFNEVEKQKLKIYLQDKQQELSQFIETL